MKHFSQSIGAIFIAAMFIFSGCSGNNTGTSSNNENEVKHENVSNSGTELVKTEEVKNIQPDWINNPGPGKVVGIGDAKIGKISREFQEKKAILNAQAKIAQSLKSNVGELNKNYQSMTGIASDNTTFTNHAASYSESLTNQSLEKYSVLKSHKDGDGVLYVLYGKDTSIESAKNTLNTLDQVKLTSARENEDALYAKFQSKEMEDEYHKRIDKQ